MDTCDIEYHDDNTQELLNDYLKKLQSVSLVITDRLHGMILSYITDTPCIVFRIITGKLSLHMKRGCEAKILFTYSILKIAIWVSWKYDKYYSKSRKA